MNERDESLERLIAYLEKHDHEWKLSEFARIRNKLLDNGKRTAELIVTWMDMFDDLGTEKEGPRNGVEWIPRGVFKEVEYLAHLRYAISLGPEVSLEEALKLRSGLDAVRVRAFSGGRPRGAFGPLRKLLAEIITTAKKNGEKLTARIALEKIQKRALYPKFSLDPLKIPNLATVKKAFTLAKKDVAKTKVEE
jgi:hypothetical protein